MDTRHSRASSGPPDAKRYAQVQRGAEFRELRRSYRTFAFPLTVGFIIWYVLYVLLSSYAADFMGSKVVGQVNMAFVLGLLQFLSTFLIAWFYSRHASGRLDARAEALRAELEGGVPAGGADGVPSARSPERADRAPESTEGTA